MAINKTALKASIKSAFLDEFSGDFATANTDAIDRIAGKIADACATAIKDGVDTATVAHELVAGGNAVTGTITLSNSIS